MAELTRRALLQRGALTTGGVIIGGSTFTGTVTAQNDVSATAGPNCGEITLQNGAGSPVTVFVDGEETGRLEEGDTTVVTRPDDDPVTIQAAKSRGTGQSRLWPVYGAVTRSREERCHGRSAACDGRTRAGAPLPPGLVVTVNGESEATVTPGTCDSGGDGGNGDGSGEEYYRYDNALVYLENQDPISTTLYSADASIQGCDVEYDITGTTSGEPCAGVTAITAEDFRYGTITGYISSPNGTLVKIHPPCLSLDLGETPPSGPLPCS